MAEKFPGKRLRAFSSEASSEPKPKGKLEELARAVALQHDSAFLSSCFDAPEPVNQPSRLLLTPE